MQHSTFRFMSGSRKACWDNIRAPTRRRVAIPTRSFQTASETLLQRHSRLSSKPRACLVGHNLPFSTRNVRRCISQTTDVVFPDPNRPDLFYHLVYAPTPVSNTLPAFALSFLERTPAAVDSASVIGWLPAQTYETDTPAEAEEIEEGQPLERTAALRDFKENPKFLKVLHETIKKGLEEGVDEVWIDSAIALQSGWMHIQDQRNIPALDRVGDPDDIIATVLVKDSKMQMETYSPMPAYRVCTADGIMQLTDGLSNYLQKKLLDLSKS